MKGCNFRTVFMGRVFVLQSVFLFVFCASAFSNQNGVSGTRPTKKYMQLDECVAGNTKEECRENFVKKTTQEALKESARKKDITLYVWMEED
ncbi:MAG: hypothetical protein H6755_03630 [Candidatus Omnitrophica bacterium]|nr:hypothetical protein [Candidatus Omnitrophota bacterium]MCB9747479.1 hypothetical protein [Candidatus Omnitrophota bacterium]